jgi:hypothetical protein
MLQRHDWLNHLSLAELAYSNNSSHSAIRFSPFEVLYGLNLLIHANLFTNDPTSAPLDIIGKIHVIHDLI